MAVPCGGQAFRGETEAAAEVWDITATELFEVRSSKGVTSPERPPKRFSTYQNCCCWLALDGCLFSVTGTVPRKHSLR